MTGRLPSELAALDWRFVAEETWDGPTNMALDEVAAETVADGGPATIRLFRWAPSTLSLGYNQDPETIDWEQCDREGIGVTRRPTGGGAIYHDNYGDISYAIVVPADVAPGNLMDTYELLCEPVLSAFDALGVDVSFAPEERPAVHQPACYLRALDPAHDVVGPDGRKIAGNAQYRRKDAVVQHGSLTYSLAPDAHCGCFTGRPDPAGFTERVGAIDGYVDVSRAEAVEAVERSLQSWADAPAGEWRTDERDRAAALAESKYGAAEWTRGGEDPTS